jgi:hypothetical protein
MIYLAQRLLREETDADKVEFVRGAAGLDNHGQTKVLASFVSGFLLTNWLKNRG